MTRQPTIIIDSREKAPLDIRAYPAEAAGLPAGDYGIKGFSDWANPAFIVERKSIQDLVGSLTGGRKRFMAEVERLRRFRFAAILIEATREEVELHSYRGMATPQSILASLDAIEVRTGVHVIWAGSPEGAARRLEGLVRQFVRGVEKDYKRLSGKVVNSSLQPGAGANLSRAQDSVSRAERGAAA